MVTVEREWILIPIKPRAHSLALSLARTRARAISLVKRSR